MEDKNPSFYFLKFKLFLPFSMRKILTKLYKYIIIFFIIGYNA